MALDRATEQASVDTHRAIGANRQCKASEQHGKVQECRSAARKRGSHVVYNQEKTKHHVTPALGMRARGEGLRVWATDSADSVGERRVQDSKRKHCRPLRSKVETALHRCDMLPAARARMYTYDESYGWMEMEERGIERGWAAARRAQAGVNEKNGETRDC